MAIFGVLGYVFAKLDCEPAPLLLGYILGLVVSCVESVEQRLS